MTSEIKQNEDSTKDEIIKHTLDIIYKDKEIIVVDKPADMCINTVYPDKHPVTVATILEEMFPHLVDHDVYHKFRFIHRLDYSTSGVLCVALTKQSAKRLSKAFEMRNVTKEYLCVLHGILEKEVTVDMPIGEDSVENHKMVVYTDPRVNKDMIRSAVTKFRPLQHGELHGHPVTLTMATPLTGRRHQIRVHALHIGHGILGDFTYTGDEMSPRMYLHAKHLTIPLVQEETFTSSVQFNLEKII